MKSFKQFLNEMAVPSEDAKSKTYFHGTHSRAAALGIAKDGFKGRETTGKSSFAPVAGKVYITPHVGYAQTYAMGASIAGTNHQMAHHETEHHGYVFAVHGSKLKDVQPDEDSIGKMVWKKSHPALSEFAKDHLGEPTHKKVMDGDYASWARAGKSLVKKMPDHLKNSVIAHGAHIAHEGPLKPDAIYRIHKDKIPHLKSDGSNFFDHAEKIEPHQI